MSDVEVKVEVLKAESEVAKTVKPPRRLEARENFVIIRPDKKQDTTEGGLLIPDAAQESPCKGIVISVGPGTYNQHGQFNPTQIKVGDHVLFHPGAIMGFQMKLEEEVEIFYVSKEYELYALID